MTRGIYGFYGKKWWANQTQALIEKQQGSIINEGITNKFCFGILMCMLETTKMQDMLQVHNQQRKYKEYQSSHLYI